MFKWSTISNARGFEYTDQGFHTILSDEQKADGLHCSEDKGQDE